MGAARKSTASSRQDQINLPHALACQEYRGKKKEEIAMNLQENEEDAEQENRIFKPPILPQFQTAVRTDPVTHNGRSAMRR